MSACPGLRHLRIYFFWVLLAALRLRSAGARLLPPAAAAALPAAGAAAFDLQVPVSLFPSEQRASSLSIVKATGGIPPSY